MHETRRNAIVGLFLILGLASLCWLLSSFGELPAWLGREGYELRIAIKEPYGIGEGTAIFLNGVQIGRVKGIGFKDIKHPDAGARIIGKIDAEYEIPSSAWAFVQPAGFGIGLGRIDLKVIEDRDAPPLPRGEEIIGTMGSVFDKMIPETLIDSVERSVNQFGNFVEALTPVAKDLHVLFELHTVDQVDNPIDEARRITANLSTVIERFDHALKTFNDTFGDPQVKAGWLEVFNNVKQMSIDGRQSLENISNITGDLRTDLRRISLKVESGVDNANIAVNRIAEDIGPVLENISLLTSSLARLAQAVEHGEGTAGMIFRDPRAYESFVLSMQRLTDMLETIQRLFAKFERDGMIRVGTKTPVGTLSKDFKVPK